jgi:prepilin-type N-terminal cleavage/methylation domain-containing protein
MLFDKIQFRTEHKYKIFSTIFSQNRGFTLIELLVALAITGIVMGLIGSGLFALMDANHRNQLETSDRLELEQAVDFITDEIKMSQEAITTFPPGYEGIYKFNRAVGSSRIQPILVLKPAPNSGLTNPIIYYLADPPNRSMWLGPRVIYRWGPTLLQTGNYSDGNNHDVLQIPRGSPVDYYNEVLVDRISDFSGERLRRQVAPQVNIACETNYNYAVPSMADRMGFYACISADRKSVKLWMYKQLNSSGNSQSVNALVVTRIN